MRLLADENFPRTVVQFLRLTGHDVLWAGNDFPGTGDREILERAEAEGRILFTLDRDFWHIAIQRPAQMRNGGMVLIRVHPATAANVEMLVRQAIGQGGALTGQAVLITPKGIDILPAGREL